MDKNSEETTGLGQIVEIDDGRIKDHLGEFVRGTVRETLNQLLEADALCKASRYERTEARQDYRSGTYWRKLDSKAGRVELKVPKLRKLPF